MLAGKRVAATVLLVLIILVVNYTFLRQNDNRSEVEQTTIKQITIKQITIKQTTQHKTYIWPTPRMEKYGDYLMLVPKLEVRVLSGGSNPLISDVVALFQEHINTVNSGSTVQNPVTSVLLLNIGGELHDNYPDGENEKYRLSVDSTAILLEAPTIFGAMRGLETFKQIYLSHENGGGKIYNVPLVIEDTPHYSYRGLMLDVARNYYKVSTILRIIDTIAALKMNVLHLHLSDDDSFAIESLQFPTLATPSTPNGPIYTQNEIKEIIKFAAVRGVRIIPEFDIPGHAGAWVGVDILAVCEHQYFNTERPWSISINPTLDSTWDVLEKLFVEMAALFPDHYFHLGGDEFDPKCWHADEQIKSWLQQKQHPLDWSYLHNYFEERLMQITNKLNKTILFWEESRSLAGKMPKSVMQIWFPRWKDQILPDFITGAPSPGKPPKIYSTHWYFYYGKDARAPGSCDTWRQCYSENPWYVFPASSDVIGGEACLWEETEDHFNKHNTWIKLFPVAQILWNSQDIVKKISADEAEHPLTQSCLNLTRRPLFDASFCTVNTNDPSNPIRAETLRRWDERTSLIRSRLKDMLAKKKKQSK